MQNFTFHNPTKLIFGKGTIGEIGPKLRGASFKKVFMIAGGGSIQKTGVYQQVVASLKRAGIEWSEAWGVRPNPVLSKVREMIQMAKVAGVDAILAVGGGSVIDSAKSVACGYFLNDVWAAYEKHEPVIRALPVYAILTLSATGTEMNGFAVITHEAEKKKWNIYGPALYPRVSIVDPDVQRNLPWSQTVNGTLDALAHIQEFYFMGGDSETTLALDESLCRSMIQVTDKLKRDPKDYGARANLAWAATLALNGISGAGQSSGDWATHGIEHALSAINPDIAHGAGLGVIFPAWITYCQNVNPAIFKRWSKNIWRSSTVAGGVRALKAKIKAWGSPTTLTELGICREQFPEIAANVIQYGMTGNLKKLSQRDIQKILMLAA
ncbi:MAG: iron-containing alcohol dehydrogenase [Candidatus Omnitrophica bacterium]|nr:iron-containing alcohol dehydrogenase [Candidatus Omnitrophota bacterium]MDD5670875.1 iron-containing alcohol dehydrogenase [Candidatus Omnitrophota bacterium]